MAPLTPPHHAHINIAHNSGTFVIPLNHSQLNIPRNSGTFNSLPVTNMAPNTKHPSANPQPRAPLPYSSNPSQAPSPQNTMNNTNTDTDAVGLYLKAKHEVEKWKKECLEKENEMIKLQAENDRLKRNIFVLREIVAKHFA